ncbi:flagellar protein FlaG [Paenibacillus sp. S3N08]|uniref:Flagellar protein FlaG n=2 Tax=Paenibacillus agricola TaxID=2716264 RepID=A0ABX0JDM8_9BACL|nr:flagellar protein FlaG [Paenibacillus agricola]
MSNYGVTPSSPAQAPVKSTSDSMVESSMANIQSVRDMKSAESRGEHVSVSDEQLIKAIDRAIKAVEGSVTSLEFSIHTKTNRIMVKVLEKDTGRIIREIPPEKTMDMVAKLWELAGIMVDERR